MPDLCRMFVDDFLQHSWEAVKTLVEALNTPMAENRRPVTLFRFKDNKRTDQTFEDNRFFLRGSVEYTNPQLTVEEVQGIIGVRMLQVCANYFHSHGLRQHPEPDDFVQICELLKKPSEEPVVAFLLNTDDVEPDRYSMNPLKASIVQSGQSALPAATVKTDNLAVDEEFTKKYDGTLISKAEANLVREHLKAVQNGSYLDFVDQVKSTQVQQLSEVFGMDLNLPALRMPLETLHSETTDGLLHHIISESHRDYDSVSQAYVCMGRSMTKRTTLLTVPHSTKGFGSKRAARGRLRFDESKFISATVTYKDTRLYPNAIDPDDVAVAKCEDSFTVTAEKLQAYSFAETPSSPQFFLYSLGSPEDAALWHGVGAFAAPQLLQSYSSARAACRSGRLIRDLKEKYGARTELPLQFNLAPEGMWVHPVHRNIDASIGSVEKPLDLACMGMRIEYLSKFK
ncbi:MAG: hypothetical protein ACE14S_09105 [Candidatus Bathyarchaeia archaeon]